MSNVIQFPKLNPNLPQPKQEAVEDVHERVKRVKIDYVETCVDQLTKLIGRQFKHYGVEMTEGEKSVKDMVMINEAIRSALMRTEGLEHPLQHVSEESFDLDGILDDLEDAEIEFLEGDDPDDQGA